MSHDNRWTAIDGEGIAWGAGAFAASILAGIIIEPYRRTIGLENITIIYLLIVVIAAAYGGRAAGLLAALSAALSYDFFLTTPYHQLVIDSLAQVVTVALLFGSGIVASLAGRARRRSTSQARQQTDALRLLNAITLTVAAGATGDADRTAAEGLYDLLDADRVTIKRTGPTGEAVVAEVGRTDEPLDTHDLPHLGPQGRLPRGFGLWHGDRPPRPSRGAAIDLVLGHDQVGELVVVMDAGRLLRPTARFTLATVAHALAAATPYRPADANGQRPVAP
jgi:K+-sensing histidine kinase KdpD